MQPLTGGAEGARFCGIMEEQTKLVWSVDLSIIFRLLSTIAVFIAVWAVASGYYLSEIWAKKTTLAQEQVEIQLERGMGLESLASVLQERGLIDDAMKFRLWVRFRGSFSRYQAGLYAFQGEVSPLDIDKVIRTGKIYNPIVLQFVIPEGFTLKQTLRRIEAKGVADFKQLWSLAHDKAFIRELGLKGANSLEGYLYPATYSFIKFPPAKDLLRHMVETFQRKLPSDYKDRLKQKGLSLHKGIIFASLIELETKLDFERPKVAEVIWNRLRRGEPLGIDAALIYGIKDYDGDIKFKHLKDRSNPYNTRIHKGLPPGPIGAVSLASLSAVLEPTKEGYYYYVLKPNSGGKHEFSKNLKDHNRNVKILLKAKR